MTSEPRVETTLRLATSAVESAQPLFAAIGGGAALGSVLGVAWAIANSDETRWDRAAAVGSVWGALGGAGLLAIDMIQRI